MACAPNQTAAQQGGPPPRSLSAGNPVNPGGRRRNSQHSAGFRPKAGNGAVLGISELAPRTGFEPAACRLGGDRSIHLSYRGIFTCMRKIYDLGETFLLPFRRRPLYPSELSGPVHLYAPGVHFGGSAPAPARKLNARTGKRMSALYSTRFFPACQSKRPLLPENLQRSPAHAGTGFFPSGLL